MIIKYYCIAILLLLGKICMAQNQNDYVTDAEGLPVCRPIGVPEWPHNVPNRHIDEWEYITSEGQKLIVNVPQDLKFKEGQDSLNQYVRYWYYMLTQFDDGYTQYIRFFILFDKDLNVVEVRQFPPGFKHKEKQTKPLFVKILKSTSGMWHTMETNKKWYVTICGVRI